MTNWLEKLYHSMFDYKFQDENVLDMYNVPVAIVYEADDHKLYIEQGEWAPGIWAGIKEAQLNVNNKFDIIVNFINMETRSMYYLGPKINKGDTLYIKHFRIEDGR